MKNNRTFLAGILLLFVLTFFISKNYLQVMLIQGNSMEPSYHSWQITLIDKREQDYYIGDVVAFYADDINAVLIKRIAAAPNDTVVIHEGKLYVNEQISEQYSSANPITYSGIATAPLTLGANQYFVLGDNLAESKDSRYENIGPIHENDILGKVIPQRP